MWGRWARGCHGCSACLRCSPPVAELRNAELRARILSIVSCYSGHFGVSFWTADLLSRGNINNHCNKNQSSQGDSVA